MDGGRRDELGVLGSGPAAAADGIVLAAAALAAKGGVDLARRRAITEALIGDVPLGLLAFLIGRQGEYKSGWSRPRRLRWGRGGGLCSHARPSGVVRTDTHTIGAGTAAFVAPPGGPFPGRKKKRPSAKTKKDRSLCRLRHSPAPLPKTGWHSSRPAPASPRAP